MLLYQDILTGDEMFSDAYPVSVFSFIATQSIHSHTPKQARRRHRLRGRQLTDHGANPSSEEQDEALEEGATQINNVVHSFRLQTTSFDKKSYLTYLKGYMKAVKVELAKTSPDKVEAFEKGASAYAKKIVANFKDYEFYSGESMNPDGLVALLNYREDGTTPYFTFWKHGLKEVKL
ncbi:translationally controlled tumor-associated [Chiua virens]|nr:translationally controlled tumor-associated [Chiua virens]